MTLARLESSARTLRERTRRCSSCCSGSVSIKHWVATHRSYSFRIRFQCYVALVSEIAPRLQSAIPRCVRTVGAEDAEELVQDGIVFAARMLQNVEQSGKQVTPGNIAYYVLQHLKSGRRSQSAGRSDVMSCGSQLDDHSSVMSIDEEIGFDPETDEPICLGDLLADSPEDPSMAAARHIDWREFLASHDYRYGPIVKSMAEGRKLSETARESGVGIGPRRS